MFISLENFLERTHRFLQFNQFIIELSLEKLLIAGGVFLTLVILTNSIASSLASTSRVILEIVSPQQKDTYQLFYDTGKGFNEQESVRYTVENSKNTVEAIFDLHVPLKQVKSIRIDPGNQATLITIKSIKLISGINQYNLTGHDILKNFKPAMYIDKSEENTGLDYVNSTGIFVSTFDFAVFSKDYQYQAKILLPFYLAAMIISIIIFCLLDQLLFIESYLLIYTILVFAAIFYLIFSPPFLSWDSYHYMGLSFYPELNNSHPLGFGFILRFIAAISRCLWKNVFVQLFILLQVISFFFIQWIIFREIDYTSRVSLIQKLLNALMILLMIVFIIPALLFLMNGFWTDMVSFLLITLTALFLSKEYALHSKLNIGLIVLFSALAYNVRYQFVILPMAVLGTAFIFYLRNSTAKISTFLKWGVVAGCTFLFILGLNYIAAIFVPESNVFKHVQSSFIQANIQCQLKCQISLFEKDCSTEEGKRLLSNNVVFSYQMCAHPIMNFNALGKPKLGWNPPVTLILKTIGVANTISWIVKTTINFLRVTYDNLDFAEFRFNKKMITNTSPQYDDALEYYGSLISTGTEPINGSLAFQGLIQWVSYANSNLNAYHFLTAVAVLSSLVIMWLSPNPASVFFSLVCVGSFLIFTIVIPIAVVRYLIQILLPGIMAIIISLTYRLSFHLSDSPGQPNQKIKNN